jgi:glycine dehydrogenase subunit 1
MGYISNTDDERRRMLEKVGAASVDELFAGIPDELRARRFELPPGRSEMEVMQHLHTVAERNASHLLLFLGGGYYDHYVPAAADALLRRGEVYTPYTPYQPEVAQGTLQAIYEYQSLICRLTGLEVANASLYDGGTALYEAVMMAMRVTGRRKIVLDSAVNPIHRNMLACYTSNLRIEQVQTPTENWRTSRAAVADCLDEDTAAVILQNPNFFGVVDDLSDLTRRAHDVGALAVLSCYPVSLALLKTPDEMEVDIATGEGQSLGLGLSFGGPYLGFMATRRKYIRQMPGRIVGETTDAEGRRGFVLTLQTREQHIRRQKATSNICTNEALCATAALVYMTLMGREGLKDVARLCADKAAYARERLAAIPGVTVQTGAPTFNEFACELPIDAAEAAGRMIDKGYAAGFPLGRYYPGLERWLLVAVTEKRTKAEIGAFADTLEGVLR